MSVASGDVVLRVRDLHVSRGHAPVLRGLDLEAHAGRVHVVLGASGSGKSTLLRACIGLLPRPATIDAAEMSLAVNDHVHDLTTDRARRAVRGDHVGLVGQDPALDLTPLRRVGSLVRESTGRRGTPVPQVLERCGLLVPGVQRRRCFQLSGGMAQRLALGLAGARGPALLLADEPSTALDALARTVLAGHLRATADAGAAVILVTHDVGFASQLADDVTVLADGRIADSGRADQLLRQPQTAETRDLVRLRAPRSRSAPEGGGARADVGGQAALEVRGLVAGWNGTPVLDGVTLRIGRGEVLGVAGRSGAGKSTLVSCLTGLLKPWGGTMRIAAHDSARAPWRQLRREVQLIPQDPRGSLNPWRSVADQVRDPLDVHGVGTASERRARVEELLAQVGLVGLGRRRPGTLSTGQCQRATIARALALRPTLLVADEPVTALDPALRADILELFAEAVRLDGTAALVISHDLYVLEHLSDRVAVLDEGRVVEELPVADLRRCAQHPLTQALVESHPPLAVPESAGSTHA